MPSWKACITKFSNNINYLIFRFDCNATVTGKLTITVYLSSYGCCWGADTINFCLEQFIFLHSAILIAAGHILTESSVSDALCSDDIDMYIFGDFKLPGVVWCNDKNGLYVLPIHLSSNSVAESFAGLNFYQLNNIKNDWCYIGFDIFMSAKLYGA